MQKLLVLLALLLFSFTFHAQKRTISPNIRKLKNDTIIWKQDSLLHKEDFKAKGKNSGPLGYASTGIFMYAGESGGELIFNIEALFIKSKSYITQYSEYVLKHEQIHFDICELYARKLRQKFSETNFTKIKSLDTEATKMYNKITAELFKEESKYDKDTEHGLNSAKQKLWDADIKARLLVLEAYSKSAIDIAK